MAHWIVRLDGDPSDLVMLAESDHSEHWRVARRDAGFVLTSEWFDSASPAEVVIQKARELVLLLSGAAMALLGTPRPFVASSLSRIRDDGHEDHYVFPEPAVVTVRGLPVSIVLTRADGTSEAHRPADPIHRWLPLAVKNENAARVLRIRARGPLDWDDLLRVIEVIQAAGVPLSQIENAPTDAALERLAKTANSVHALGDEARHPGRNYEPPANPMPLADARSLVDRLIDTWFTHLVKRVAA